MDGIAVGVAHEGRKLPEGPQDLSGRFEHCSKISDVFFIYFIVLVQNCKLISYILRYALSRANSPFCMAYANRFPFICIPVAYLCRFIGPNLWYPDTITERTRYDYDCN